jgi:hypothetical protein
MTLAEYSMTAFALLNGARVVAYMPQIICVYRDPNGAVAVSLLTWIMFTAANLATVSYALTVSSDLVVAVVFALNALGCLTIATLIAVRRLARSRPPRSSFSGVADRWAVASGKSSCPARERQIIHRAAFARAGVRATRRSGRGRRD